MKIEDPGPETLRAATSGNLPALDRLLLGCQPGVYNLAVRVLGNRDDAADATQEILLKIATHLGSFRGESAFPTWVWRVAHNHLITARTRSLESPTVSLDAMAERLEQGLDFATTLAESQGAPVPLTPQDKLEARQLALACTQSMLMAMGREDRLVYVLDTVFDLPSEQAAGVVGISPAAYRQRLSRTRARWNAFVGSNCGVANPQAACRCERQLPAARHVAAAGSRSVPVVAAQRGKEMDEAERNFSAFTRVSDAAAVFRAHPDYQAPDNMILAIRVVLTQEGFMQRKNPQ
ncbi:MAG: RNA polymerase sigma factor [Rhizobacter sp.]